MIPKGKVSLPYRSYHFLWNALDWVFPPACCGCGKLGDRWCHSCLNQVIRLEDVPICPICGAPTPNASLCHECRNNPPDFTALRSWGIYHGSLRQAIQQLKYERNIGLGETFAPLLLSLLGSLAWEFDLMIPVPLSKQRFQERGYNQSKYMAIPLHLALDIPISDRALVRTQHTTSQVGLTGQERRENVCHAFTARSEEVEEKNILVIDDVTTTGATMRACSTALMEAGARKVYGITLARAGLAAHPESLLG